MRVLGIESSCDETAVALYDDVSGLLGHELYSQVDLHMKFGGVVPELASRDHIVRLLPLLRSLLASAGVSLDQLDGVAYTKGPGLVGGLLVGAAFGRTLAWALGIPAVGVHHMEAHLLAVMLEDNHPVYPFLALLVSGGHTMLVEVKGLGQYRLLGETLDDAAGEAFDKTAKLLGLPYPGGPEISRLAEKGDAKRFNFPRPMLGQPGLDFSFSGLKTAVMREVRQQKLTDALRADLAASFQAAIVEVLVMKCRRALYETSLERLVVSGGVAANLFLRKNLNKMCAKEEINVFYPRQAFCTDNAAMVAYAGCQHLKRGEKEDLSINVFPRRSLG